MCRCNACLEIGVGALRWFGKFVAESCLSQKTYNALQQGDEKKLGNGAFKNSATRGVDSCEYSDELQCNIILNPTFSEGTNGWVGVGCSLAVGSYHGSNYCVVHGRKEKRQGLAQEIGKRLDVGVEYRVEAWVGMRGGQAEQAAVQATVKLEKGVGSGNEYIFLSSVTVRKGQWSLLAGTLRVSEQPHRATVCFDGPIGGIDILVSSVGIVPVSTIVTCVEDKKETDVLFIADTKLGKQVAGPPVFENPKYEVNIVDNSDLRNGLDSWYGMGNCTLNIVHGAPRFLGASAKKSLVNSPTPILSGKSIYASNRTEIWEGPAQDITDKVQLFQSYQVFAWVATTLPRGSTNSVTPQKVNVALDVDGQWVNGGEVLAGSAWTELASSFRLESKPKKVVVYLQGPVAGVDVMMSGLQIFAVDRLARVPELQQQTENVRKRDVVVTLRDSQGRLLPPGTKVCVQQTKNNFPLGTVINHSSLQDKPYRDFFLNNFNWAVFENELKWDQVEPEQGQIHYEKADDMVRFCQSHNISMRGHCIIWEAWVPEWVKQLEGTELLEAVQNRFSGLLSRYKGNFRHYDVDNEILHGSFYEDKLGIDFLPYVFKLAHQLDPEAALFVNDYHVEDGYDCTSSPERYVDLVKFLLAKGARIGGIGVQGHSQVPVGPILSQALNVLSTLNIPIWFTEVDVTSLNEYVRADDLEVLFREAFAHPAVEGCLLWGFMEKAMYTENAQLIDSDSRITAAGRRLIDLKKEWTTSFEGAVDDNGELIFRGFYGDYTLSVDGREAGRTFEVTKDDSVSIVDLSI